MDPMVQMWLRLCLYGFPPIALILEVLESLQFYVFILKNAMGLRVKDFVPFLCGQTPILTLGPLSGHVIFYSRAPFTRKLML